MLLLINPQGISVGITLIAGIINLYIFMDPLKGLATNADTDAYLLANLLMI